MNTETKNITLNGETVTKEKLEEIRKDSSKKLIEESPNTFRVIERMKG